jgi:uncharacterized membrane protein
MSRDPLLSHAIGTFTATFLYAIAVRAWVDRQSSGKVPFLSAWLVVGLLLASVTVFVRLVQSVSRLQINRVLVFTGDFARQIIDRDVPAAREASCLGRLRRFPVRSSDANYALGRPAEGDSIAERNSPRSFGRARGWSR